MSPDIREVTATTVILPARCRSDGYVPLTYAVMVWSGFHDKPRDARFWYFSSLARKLDFAHLQFERVRVGIAALKTPSEYLLETAMEVLSDAEAAMTALHRACSMSEGLQQLYGAPALPRFVTIGRLKAIEELRHAYEHVDDRALGCIYRNKPDIAEAHSVFLKADFGRNLVELHQLSYRQWTFDVDSEASTVCTALRDYVMTTWKTLVT